MSDIKNVEVEEMINEVNDIKSNLKFIIKNESTQFERIIDLYKELFNQTKKVIYLIEICRLDKRMHSKYTFRSVEAAKLAFNIKKIELTLYYYISCVVLKSPVEQQKKLLEDAFINLKTQDSNLLGIKDLYLGSLSAVSGDFLTYNSYLAKAKEKCNSKLYWQLKSVVTDFYCGANDEKFLDSDYSLTLKEINNYDYVVSVSCDQVYFDYYVEYYLRSIFKLNKKVIVHLYIVNIADRSYVLEKIKEWIGEDSSRVIVNFFNCPKNIDHRPVSAVLRLLAINQLLKFYKKPVVFSEIDAIVLKDFQFLINELQDSKSTQLVRLINPCLPWQRFTCGLGIYLYNESGLHTAKLLEQYIKGIFNRTDNLWWADQCALEASIRYSILIDPKYKFYTPKGSRISDYIVTPTGGGVHEKKRHLLKEKFSLL